MKVFFQVFFILFIVIFPSFAFSVDNDSRRHTSPIPTLIATYVSGNHAVPKGLLEQQAVLDDLHISILQEEEELFEATLDNEEMDALDQIGLLLMQSRLELITQGTNAVKLLKSEISETEYADLIATSDTVTAKELLTSKSLQLAHTNPLPNLVDFLLRHDTKPSLLNGQKERLKKWQSERASVIAQQSQSIVDMEVQLSEMVLHDGSIEAISSLADTIAQLRVRIIRGKVFSRERVKQILENEQYQNLLGLYPTE